MDEHLRKAFALICIAAALIIGLFLLFTQPAQAANTNGPRWAVISDDVSSAVLETGIIPSANSLWHNVAQGHAHVTNVNLSAGSTGYVLNPAAGRLLVEALPGMTVEGVILALGSHDFGTGQNITLVQANAKAMVERVKALGVKKVVCLTPIKRWDQRTRRGPNPGQVSAYGYTLVPITGVNRLTYSGAIALGCTAGGADVILGYGAPTVLGFAHYTPALAGTTIFQYLSTEGHRVLGEWMALMMKNRGHWQ